MYAGEGRPVVVVHGGAGNRMGDIQELRAGCENAAAAGLELLEQEASALAAVEAAVAVMEDNPIFNAGTGGALNRRGELELDASIMEGTRQRAGGVAALPPFLHPVQVARAVLEDGRHVLYAGEGARGFAERAGFTPVPMERMLVPRTQRRLEAHLEKLEDGAAEEVLDSLETVGAVALDPEGHVAAATSTGGTTGQLPGRVGDTPLIGCGTYADDTLGACSVTGKGESIIRATLTYRVVQLLAGMPAQDAAEQAIGVLVDRFGGEGGLILVDRSGRVGIHTSTRAMSHAVARPGLPVQSGT